MAPATLHSRTAPSRLSSNGRAEHSATIQRVMVAGSLKSRLLVHPLEEQAGGDFYHSGGKHFISQNDAEWQTLKAFVLGQTAK